MSVPSNWRELQSHSSVTFAPEGAYGQYNGGSVFTHGLEIGIGRNETHDLQTSTNELLDSLDSNYLGWSAATAPVIMGNPDRPELGVELTNSFCRTDPRVAQVFAKATFLSDNRDDLTASGTL